MTRTGLKVDVYVVVSEVKPVIRVTGDPADAERYRKVFSESNSWGKVEILKRVVTI